jgi:TRAP-type transport system periplasmic protein
MKRWHMVILTVVVGFSFLFSPIMTQTTLSAEKISLKAVSYLTPPSKRIGYFEDFLKMVSDRSKGQVEIKYLGGPEVIPPTEQGQALRKGVVDLSLIGATHIRGLVPEAQLLALSRIPISEEWSSGANDYLRKCYEKGDLYFLGRGDPKESGTWPLYLKKKVQKPEDLKGIKLGAGGAYVQALAQALGMSFMVIKTEDIYSALDRGLVDAYATALDTATGYSIQEVAKFILDYRLYRANTSIVFGLNTWNKLPDNIRKLFQDTYLAYQPQLAKLSDQADADALKLFRDAKVEFLSFSPGDKERYFSIAYDAEAALKMKEMPNTAPTYLKMVKAIK